MKAYYTILEVTSLATPTQIRRKTYTKGKLLHPGARKSLQNDPSAFIELIEAYTVLHDKKTKEVYDWILEHEKGICKLHEEALSAHYKTLEKASIQGVHYGKSLAKAPFWEFKDDFRTFNWWNIADLLELLDFT